VSAAIINVRVNDAPRAFAGPLTLQDALQQIGVAERKGVAVAINDNVVPRREWPARPLNEGERVLIIQATQGG
jgi:sulfur carrier protein